MALSDRDRPCAAARSPWNVHGGHFEQLGYEPDEVMPAPGGELATVERRGTVLPRFTGDGSAFVPVGGPASPWAVGGFEIVAAAPFTAARVEWQAGTGYTGELRAGPSAASGSEHRCRVDVSTDAPFVVFGALGGISRVAVELHGPDRPRAVALVAMPPAELAPLRRTLRDARLALASIGAGLAWDSLPANAEPGSASVVLMNRSFGWRLARPTTGFDLPPPVALHLSQSRRIGGEDRIYYFLECRVDGRPWRSQVDWFLDDRR